MINIEDEIKDTEETVEETTSEAVEETTSEAAESDTDWNQTAVDVVNNSHAALDK